MDVEDRIAGALLGVHAGDALGATVEFSPWADIRERYPEGVREIVGGGPFLWPPGHATDDTDLTRAVLLAYLQPGDDIVRTAADNMLDWLAGRWPGRGHGRPPRDVGRATLTGLRRYEAGGDPYASGCGTGQAGNGSLMRCIPTALAVRDRDRRIHESMRISAITHADPRCTVACACYNEIVASLLASGTAEESVEIGRSTATELGSQAVADAIGYGTHLKPEMLVRTGQTFLEDEAAGYVLDSLSLAVAALLDPRPLHEALIDIVRIGNDTDTNGAIAGGLLGARDGVQALPAQWVSVLQFGDEFRAAATALAGQRTG
ncbi:ADP-ribosylglycohydrolase family protein [Allorhizocola rhizosphaerae]|uniref:ADP-ribosylglycohydrolase family protein n=1 Tax=Allorhizocola rhizosphaerae TaxID=1872709 RepID=UPI0013C359EA|nr:ADP-ribosylglycohydrolase family protein [Allorhizocola rhizosphaerae]